MTVEDGGETRHTTAASGERSVTLAGRDRIDRREHHRSDQARALSAIGSRRSARIPTPRRWPRWRARSARASRRSATRRLIANSRMRLSGTGIEAAAGDDALVEAARAAGAMGDRRDHRRGRIEADAGGRRARRHRRARQQGMPGLRRRTVHAPRGAIGRDGAAGRFRAQRAVPGDERRPARGCAARDPDCVGRTVPHLDRGGRSAPRRRSRRSSIRTGRWVQRSRSIRRR